MKRILLPLALLTIFMVRLWTAASGSPLFADGTHLLVSLLSQTPQGNTFSYANDSQHPRLFIDLINQLFVNLGVLSGIRDLGQLRLLTTLPLVFFPLIIILYIFFRGQKTDGLPKTTAILGAMSFVIFVLPSEVFASNQGILSFSLYWLFAFIMSKKENSLAEIICLYILSGIFFLSHENIIIAGPALFLIGLFSLKKKYTLTKAICCLLPLAAATINLFWHFNNNTGPTTDNYLYDFKNIFTSPHSLNSCLLISLAAFFATPLLLRLKTTALYTRLLCTLPLFALITLLLTLPHGVEPYSEFNYRTLITAACVFFYIPPLLEITNWSIQKKLESPAFYSLFFSTLFSFSLWQGINSYYWLQMVDAMRSSLEKSNGIIEPVQIINTNLAAKKFDARWSWPSLSILYHPKSPQTSLIAPSRKRELLEVQDQSVLIPFAEIPLHTVFWSLDFSAPKESP